MKRITRKQMPTTPEDWEGQAVRLENERREVARLQNCLVAYLARRPSARKDAAQRHCVAVLGAVDESQFEVLWKLSRKIV